MKAPQHRYMFLTKNPNRYRKLIENGILPLGTDFMFGVTITKEYDPSFWGNEVNRFLSVEPIQRSFKDDPHFQGDSGTCWVIIGAETGNRKDRVVPKKECVLETAERAETWGVPVFMKESLREIMGKDFRQEYHDWWNIRFEAINRNHK